jgi:hypothetical protein
MESARWWLLLVAAVMFSMSGCASNDQWAQWRAHPTHFASGDHWSFSSRTNDASVLRITERDLQIAMDQSWWGELVPGAPPYDFSGRWRGAWHGVGLFSGPRDLDADAWFMQRGAIGIGHVLLWDTVAADVPTIIRQEGSRGVRVVYEASGPFMRVSHEDGARTLRIVFRMVGDRLIGTFPDSPSSAVIVLTRVS